MRRFPAVVLASVFALGFSLPVLAADSPSHSCSKADQAHCTKADAASCKNDKECVKAHCNDAQSCNKTTNATKQKTS